MSKVTIADVLHYAADEELLFDRDSYSCAAIRWALLRLDAWHVEYAVYEGLSNLGLNTDSERAFDEFPAGPKRQAARYAWLKFAALLAEEQGV